MAITDRLWQVSRREPRVTARFGRLSDSEIDADSAWDGEGQAKRGIQVHVLMCGRANTHGTRHGK